MKKFIFSFFSLLILTNISYSQLDDLLKKIPGVKDVFEEAVTTSIRDAYPSALWLNELDKQISLEPDEQFSTNLNPGYYKFRFNTFCLHAGAYEPTEGAGYLVAPLKGAKAKLIKNILSRYSEHSEIDQKDVQILIWGIEAGQKFSNYPANFQFRVTPLLKPEEIAAMEVDTKEIAYNLLPQDAKNIIDYYKDLRGKLSNASSSYEEIEQFAVKTGIAPTGKGSKNIDAGTWTSIGDGVYMRCFPEGYRKSNVEIYIPSDVKIQKDNTGKVVSLDNGSFKIELNYETGAANFKTANIKNLASNEEITLENNLTDDASVKKDADDFISLVKKSFGKKKSGRLSDESIKSISQLKSIERTLNSIIDKNAWAVSGYSMSVNALNNYVSQVEAGTKKGGGKNRKTGLSDINGFVFAPANTAQQRLGNGGPEGGPPKKPKKPEGTCNITVSLSQIGDSELPEPNRVYNVFCNIYIDGTDDDCNAEEIKFELFDVSKEPGRCMNDLEQYDDVDEDLQIDPSFNSSYNITKLTAEKQISGKSQSQQIYIECGDWGAYGKLKASVKVKGQWYEAEGDGTPDKYITIPRDLNNNHIADGWEKQNGVYGKPAEWDEDPNPSGQARTGDGLTNYEEYRGFFVSDGASGVEHIRTDPNKKDIFIIDDDQIFPKTEWEAASGITSHWLTSSMVYSIKAGGDLTQYRWVDFCQSTAPGKKYAVRLIKATGMSDPFGNYPEWQVGGYNYPGYGPPIKADRTVVFPERVRWWLTSSADSLEAWLIKYPSGFQVDKDTYTPKQVHDIIDEIRNPAKQDVLVEFWNELNIVHEVGHACNVYHHGGGDTSKTTTGDPKCPMKYRGDNEILTKSVIGNIFRIIDKEGIVPIVVYTGWRFCKKNDNCWKQLDVNDK